MPIGQFNGMNGIIRVMEVLRWVGRVGLVLLIILIAALCVGGVVMMQIGRVKVGAYVAGWGFLLGVILSALLERLERDTWWGER